MNWTYDIPASAKEHDALDALYAAIARLKANKCNLPYILHEVKNAYDEDEQELS